ncbi:MAG: hypothetical protein V1934_03280 [Methanobacteriota archaeon]
MDGGSPERVRDWQLNYAAAVVTIFAGYISLRYAEVLIHEILGHGAAARLLGGSFFAVYATPMSGFASLHLPGVGGEALAAVLLAGIAVTTLLGLAALAIARSAKGAVKIALLLFAESALMSSALYLAFGGLRADGDPYVAAAYLGLDHNALAPLGIILALIFSVLVSREFARVDVFREKRPLLRIIGLWLPGLVFGIVALSAFAMDVENRYAGLYGGTYVFAAIGSAYVASTGSPREPAPVRLGTARQVMAVFVCLAIASYAWVGVFGPTADEARGVMLEEPPVEVESSYFDSVVGNARVELHPNGSALVEVAFKPLNDKGSSLDKKLHATFETRPYLPDWALACRRFATGMMNLLANESALLNVTAELSGTVQALNQTYQNARTCTVWVELNVSQNYTITLVDPWMKNGGYVDMLTVEWAGNMTLLGYNQTGGSPPELSGNSLVWNSASATQAPSIVEIKLTP